MGDRWTLEELRLLRQADREGWPIRELHARLPGRGFRALQKKLYAMNLTLPLTGPATSAGRLLDPGPPPPTCAWPLTADRPWRFCGAPALPGKPYCAEHQAQAVATPVEWKKSNLPNDLFRLR